ncbi:hypothetical protein CRE_06659 [Caenorhabditis remanei]|uniref:Uncharacterized protein n=1 Tax=Caenorhabditis remanei TaxID=31234 RepID=E3M0S0_CAERE|nr:hypothetical protein CRE_06659 [Caenorhabditis remanei]
MTNFSLDYRLDIKPDKKSYRTSPTAIVKCETDLFGNRGCDYSDEDKESFGLFKRTMNMRYAIEFILMVAHISFMVYVYRSSKKSKRSTNILFYPLSITIVLRSFICLYRIPYDNFIDPHWYPAVTYVRINLYINFFANFFFLSLLFIMSLIISLKLKTHVWKKTLGFLVCDILLSTYVTSVSTELKFSDFMYEYYALWLDKGTDYFQEVTSKFCYLVPTGSIFCSFIYYYLNHKKPSENTPDSIEDQLKLLVIITISDVLYITPFMVNHLRKHKDSVIGVLNYHFLFYFPDIFLPVSVMSLYWRSDKRVAVVVPVSLKC